MNIRLLIAGFILCLSLGPSMAAPLVDDRELTVRTSDDVTETRRRLIRFVWGSDKLPSGLPARINRGASSPIGSTPKLSRVDALHIEMEAGQQTIAYHFIASTNATQIVVVHQGHGCQLDSYGVGDLIRALLVQGYSVLGLHMPRCRPEDCEGSCTAAHEKLFASAQLTNGSPLKFFLEPIAVSLNYLDSHGAEPGLPNYKRFHIAGLSGGGWTTTVYVALDPRITLSFPVAGTMPLYTRTGASVGDVEQTLPDFYRIAGYPDLYVLGSFGEGRRQVQILNRKDNCCFGEAQHSGSMSYQETVRSYEQRVAHQMQKLGAGSFRLEIDEVAPNHQVSPHAITSIILRELQERQ